MKWAVEIQKTALEPRNLRDLLNGLGFSVFETTRGLALTSEEMNNCSAAADVFDLAKRVRAAMTGPAGIDIDFQLGSVVDFSADPPKRHAFLEVHSAVQAQSSTKAVLTINPPSDLSEEELNAWKKQRAEREYEAELERQRARLEPAFRSDRAAKVLRLLSEEKPTGETLYKIYELAEGHPSDRTAFQSRYDISLAEFQRFQDAVHNPSVSGDWARHAYAGKPRSDRPMSRNEAREFVRRIAVRWLADVRRSA